MRCHPRSPNRRFAKATRLSVRYAAACTSITIYSPAEPAVLRQLHLAAGRFAGFRFGAVAAVPDEQPAATIFMGASVALFLIWIFDWRAASARFPLLGVTVHPDVRLVAGHDQRQL